MKTAVLIVSFVAAAFVAVPAASDTPPPKTTIAAGPIGPTNSTTASFMFSADQPGSRYSCALDSATFGACTSPITYSGLGDGQHTFSVYATDNGQRGESATWSWVVDTVPPAPVSGTRATVRYGRLALSWTRSADTDHVVILRSVGGSTTATQVYAGSGGRYSDAKFINGVEHRYSFVSYDKAGNVSPAVEVTVKPSSLLLAPGDGSRVRAKHPPPLRWRGVRRASFYNVQLWRGKSKVLSTWPHRARLGLGRRWTYGGRHYHLRPGLYQWFVWPGFGAPQKGIYGLLLGTATFRVS